MRMTRPEAKVSPSLRSPTAGLPVHIRGRLGRPAVAVGGPCRTGYRSFPCFSWKFASLLGASSSPVGQIDHKAPGPVLLAAHHLQCLARHLDRLLVRADSLHTPVVEED